MEAIRGVHGDGRAGVAIESADSKRAPITDAPTAARASSAGGYPVNDTFERSMPPSTASTSSTATAAAKTATTPTTAEASPRTLTIALPDGNGSWSRATRHVLESRAAQESLATFLALCSSEGRVLWALLKGHWRNRVAGAGFTSFLGWLWEFFSRTPEETLRTLKSLHLPSAEREAISKIVIGRGARMIGTSVGVAQAAFAWNALARTMDNEASSRTERIVRFVVFGASLLGCFPRLPQLRWISSGIGLAGAVFDAVLWNNASRTESNAGPHDADTRPSTVTLHLASDGDAGEDPGHA